MRGKDKKALHGKTIAELVSLLKEKRDQLAKTRMETGMNKIKNVHTGTLLRREIAIIETVRRGKELANG